MVNVATGIATVEPELEDVMRSLKATKMEILRNVGLPRSMPYFFASLKVAITLAFVGSVISESIASNHGIGNLMLQDSKTIRVLFASTNRNRNLPTSFVRDAIELPQGTKYSGLLMLFEHHRNQTTGVIENTTSS